MTAPPARPSDSRAARSSGIRTSRRPGPPTDGVPGGDQLRPRPAQLRAHPVQRRRRGPGVALDHRRHERRVAAGDAGAVAEAAGGQRARQRAGVGRRGGQGGREQVGHVADRGDGVVVLRGGGGHDLAAAASAISATRSHRRRSVPGSRQRAQRAPANRPGSTAAWPDRSVPHIGCPPTKRSPHRAATLRSTGVFTEPRSVTVRFGGDVEVLERGAPSRAAAPRGRRRRQLAGDAHPAGGRGIAGGGVDVPAADLPARRDQGRGERATELAEPDDGDRGRLWAPGHAWSQGRSVRNTRARAVATGRPSARGRRSGRPPCGSCGAPPPPRQTSWSPGFPGGEELGVHVLGDGDRAVAVAHGRVDDVEQRHGGAAVGGADRVEERRGRRSSTPGRIPAGPARG